MAQEFDLFGNPIIANADLKRDFGANPFTIIDTKDGLWQARKKKWINMGIKSEIGREAVAIHAGTDDYRSIKNKEGYDNRDNYVSIFDPVLCELMYRWFCPVGGVILDPFAGGSVRGIVANYLGYRYTGVDIRREQIESNRAQASQILKLGEHPTWIEGDSNVVLDELANQGNTYDLVFTCPPYVNLEVYSDLRGDISTMEYDDFIFALESIMRKCCKMLNRGGVLRHGCRRRT